MREESLFWLNYFITILLVFYTVWNLQEVHWLILNGKTVLMFWIALSGLQWLHLLMKLKNAR